MDPTQPHDLDREVLDLKQRADTLERFAGSPIREFSGWGPRRDLTAGRTEVTTSSWTQSWIAAGILTHPFLYGRVDVQGQGNGEMDTRLSLTDNDGSSWSHSGTLYSVTTSITTYEFLWEHGKDLEQGFIHSKLVISCRTTGSGTAARIKPIGSVYCVDEDVVETAGNFTSSDWDQIGAEYAP